MNFFCVRLKVLSVFTDSAHRILWIFCHIVQSCVEKMYNRKMSNLLNSIFLHYFILRAV